VRERGQARVFAASQPWPRVHAHAWRPAPARTPCAKVERLGRQRRAQTVQLTHRCSPSLAPTFFFHSPPHDAPNSKTPPPHTRLSADGALLDGARLPATFDWRTDAPGGVRVLSPPRNQHLPQYCG